MITGFGYFFLQPLILSRFLFAAPQKYAPKFLYDSLFTMGFTHGYINSAPSELRLHLLPLH